jgi:UDP-N-acetylglucosamine 4,6-dehydratase/5-epimerase
MNFSGATLLITGGTGSFGNAVLHKFLEKDIREIRIFSRDEKKQDDMRHRIQDDRAQFIIGDVRDRNSVDDAMCDVDYVFHAAALKQVPSCEFFPMEAVKTNILGAQNVICSAISHAVQKLIVLSTDKAVYPINAMGLSKAMMEKLMLAKARTTSDTVLCGTRYGNVMCSRGSVIPLFIDQIKRGEPLSITNPDMTRFMMSLDDAVELVEYAFDKADPGDIYVHKAPACTVQDLAFALIELFDAKVPVLRPIGTRHGEKLYETFLTREEMVDSIDLGEYYCIQMDKRGLNYTIQEPGVWEEPPILDYNSHNAHRLTIEEIKERLMKLEYIRKELSQWHS